MYSNAEKKYTPGGDLEGVVCVLCEVGGYSCLSQECWWVGFPFIRLLLQEGLVCVWHEIRYEKNCNCGRWVFDKKLRLRLTAHDCGGAARVDPFSGLGTRKTMTRGVLHFGKVFLRLFFQLVQAV
jgi:hypothetical protein